MEDVKVKSVNPTNNMVDPLTKPFSQLKIKIYLEKMGLQFADNWL